MRLIVVVALAGFLVGCASTLRCPGEPLSQREIDNIREIQRALLEGRRRPEFLTVPVAEYWNMCGGVDPVSKERVLR